MAETNKTGRIVLPERLPVFMTLEVTKQCNYRCPFCYCIWHEFPETAGAELDTAEWKHLIDGCIRKGVKSLLFSGGEPLLRDDIRELLDQPAYEPLRQSNAFVRFPRGHRLEVRQGKVIFS